MRTETYAENLKQAAALFRGDSFNPMKISRRRALQGIFAGVAGLAVPGASFGQIEIPPGQIRLVFNENPYGPSPKALAQIAKILPLPREFLAVRDDD